MDDVADRAGANPDDLTRMVLRVTLNHYQPVQLAGFEEGGFELDFRRHVCRLLTEGA